MSHKSVSVLWPSENQLNIPPGFSTVSDVTVDTHNIIDRLIKSMQFPRF